MNTEKIQKHNVTSFVWRRSSLRECNVQLFLKEVTTFTIVLHLFTLVSIIYFSSSGGYSEYQW